MRAAILEELGKPFEVRDDVELIGPGPGEARVRIVGSGVCGSDLNMWTNPDIPTPCVMGHEAAGVVSEVGAGVTNVAEGDHVILAFLAPCGTCPECSSGHSNLCRTAWKTRDLATSAEGGPPRLKSQGRMIAPVLLAAFAEEAVVQAEAAIKIPPDVPLDLAALLGCGVLTGTGAALNTARVQPGSSVAVMGCGGVGINVIQGARIAGAAVIVAVDPVKGRHESAKRFGATHCVSPDELQAVSEELTDGLGFDYTFEVSGKAFRAAFDHTRRGGTIVSIGLLAPEATLPLIDLAISERKILGSFYGSAHVHRDLPRLVSLWRHGKLDLEGLITRRIDLAEVNEAFASMRAGEGIRNLIEFS